MAWLAQSIANSLRLEDNDDDDRANHTEENDVAPVNRKKGGDAEPIYHQQKQQKEEEAGGEGEEARGRGVKEDFADLKESLAQKLWGAASFLAPPPGASVSYLDQSSGDEGEPTESEGITGGFSEIGGKFRTGISMMASNYHSLGSEEDWEVEVGEEEGGEVLEEQNDEECEEWDGEEAVGVTDETLAFASNIALHPETWLDFPLDEEEDLDDFEMSDAQREHAFLIEQLAPRLAALRTELCHCHMAESYFWKVYFVLLHSRLNKHDAEILSTAQVMEARAMWMQELQKQTKPESDWCGRSLHLIDSTTIPPEDFDSPRTFHFEQAPCTAEDYDIEKHVVVETETQFIGKAVSEEKPVAKTEEKDLPTDPSSKIAILNFEDDDDWPDEEDSDLVGYKAITPMCNVEDISFSDLEDDASGT